VKTLNMKRTKLNDIVEQFPDEEILKADGYDDCIIGYDYGMGEDIRLIYSVKKVLSKLIKKDWMTPDEAIEYFEFNMRGSYMGEKTPIWCQDDF
jgi:hypothetical protein